MKLHQLYEMQQELIKSKEDIAKNQIIKTFSSHVPDAINITVKFGERYVTVNYDIEIDGVLYKNESSVYEFGEDLANVGVQTSTYIDYIKQLRKQYPEYCKQNDYIQARRQYKKSFKLNDFYYGTPFNLNGELCNYLKLPNTTSCSCGGGDYEIKRTPIRVEQFLSNIETCISQFESFISELKDYKNGLEEILNESVKEE